MAIFKLSNNGQLSILSMLDIENIEIYDFQFRNKDPLINIINIRNILTIDLLVFIQILKRWGNIFGKIHTHF